VSTNGEVKLVDFGIARAAERLQHSTTGAIRGKYGYMSPQQAAGAELDGRSDLFSAGVVAWELLTGTRPFDGASDLLTLDRVRFHDPGSIERVADVPEDLARIIDRLLAKDPNAPRSKRCATTSSAPASCAGNAIWPPGSSESCRPCRAPSVTAPRSACRSTTS
jgi:serine/threonine protein kinase